MSTPIKEKTCECGEVIEDWAHNCYWCARQEQRDYVADLQQQAQTDEKDTEL